MAYQKQIWASGETGKTPITPAALNHMEQGIADAMRRDGGTMTGVFVLTENVHFGTAYPANPVKGQLYILIPEGE